MKFQVKNIFYIVFGFLILMINQSCTEDFLEQPIEAVTNIDSVFADPDRAMLALWQVYGDANNNILNGGLNYADVNGWAGNSMMLGFCDEGVVTEANLAKRMLDGTWGPDIMNPYEFSFSGVAKAMRSATIFIDNADKVPYQQTPSWNWNETFKNQVVSEAKFWLAFLHFEKAKRFGGIPIIDKTPQYKQVDGGLQIIPGSTRQSLRSTYNFILKLCDEIIPHLPDEYPDAQKGRITKGAALALKSKVLLFTASRWYNEAPVLSYGDSRDSLICFQTVDPQRWEKARNAAKAAIDWAESNGYELLDDPGYTKHFNYTIATCSPTSQAPLNREVILDRRDRGNGQPPDAFFWQGSHCHHSTPLRHAAPGVEFVRNYFRTMDGKDIDFPDQGSWPELKSLVKQLEPRFHAIVRVPGYYYADIDNTGQQQTGGRDSSFLWFYDQSGALKLSKSSEGLKFSGPYYGFFNMKKWFSLGGSNLPRIGFPLFRFAELYLNYAEAANEVNPNDPLIIEYLNKIRIRGGIPILEAGEEVYDLKFGNKNLMRDEIIRERAIELYGEEHRYFDTKRWKMADVNGGDWPLIELYENGTGIYSDPQPGWTVQDYAENNEKLSYRIVLRYESVLITNRIWSDKMYFYPWYRTEVSKGEIIQNPGWQ